MYELTPIPALQTNYIWAIRSPVDPKNIVIVDPGAAEPVIDYLTAQNLTLAAILITHHHYDHTDGLDALLAQYPCAVYAGSQEPVTQASHRLKDNESFLIEPLNLQLRAMHVPGHTKGHTAYYGHEMVFTGDTLFAAGCGRNFEGTPEQLYQSLLKLKSLPKETQIYCGHEYTLQNLNFALQVEPTNADILSKHKLVQIMHNDGQCTLPSSIAEEIKTNVFLRCEEESVREAASQYAKKDLTSPEQVFAALREWKNRF